MSLYEEDELSEDFQKTYVDLIKVNCSSKGCSELTKRFCLTCKKWFCKQHISNHTELQ
jgi:hypothetical protein